MRRKGLRKARRRLGRYPVRLGLENLRKELQENQDDRFEQITEVLHDERKFNLVHAYVVSEVGDEPDRPILEFWKGIFQFFIDNKEEIKDIISFISSWF